MKKKNKTYQLLVFIEDCSMKMKKFDTKEEMGKFVADFHKKYPGHLAIDSGYWIDYCIFDVSGEIVFFTDGVKFK